MQSVGSQVACLIIKVAASIHIGDWIIYHASRLLKRDILRLRAADTCSIAPPVIRVVSLSISPARRSQSANLIVAVYFISGLTVDLTACVDIHQLPVVACVCATVSCLARSVIVAQAD
jgi:hypothetical protein